MYRAVQPSTTDGAEDWRLVPDQDGWVRLVGRLPYLYPGTSQMYGFTIYIPKGMRSFDVIVLVSSADAEFQHIDLTVNIDPAQQT